jgi:O-antigen polymerase
MSIKSIHYPTLVVCLVSVFCISAEHLEFTDAIRRCWTIVSIIILSTCYGFRLLFHHSIKPLSLDKILKTFCFVGLLEIGYALLQLSGVEHNYFRFHFFSGSFENPAVFGMFLSFCLPISYYYALKAFTIEKKFWYTISAIILLFIILSESRTALISSTSAVLLISYIELNKIKALLEKKHVRWLFIICLLTLGLVLYIYKSGSADGRLLIWRISLRMIADNPLLGWGNEGFISQYMNRQAEYFIQNPDSPFSILAGEVSHPFNEFIFISVNYGIVSLFIIFAFALLTLRMILHNTYPQRSLITSIFVVLNVWCLFSYPSAVPFVWLIILFLIITAYEPLFKNHKPKLISICILCICIISFITTYRSYSKEFYRIYMQEKSESNQDDEIMEQYADMYEDYKDNRLFLYNYGALLHYTGKYKESLIVLKKCAHHMADYNVRLLIGDDFLQLDMLDSAITEFHYANYMIPCRYLPLYYEMKLYQDSGKEDKAKELANIILKKTNKVNKSAKVRMIKNLAKDVLAE